ncbi:unnamed protein product [Phytophthora fragariaefolia]|uniref:Unnamed protein product n=1 Tax=Phytophthora fragariaefolia TaxID=1490495 RepID=A0A9W6YBX7_9STRA|nr:unnamed protein product [Phytophthora fragariaefolia]
MHCYKFPDDETAAKLLAIVIDLYFVIMVNGERNRRVDLTKDESNAEMTKELVDPLKSMLFHINSRDKPISASALMVQQLPYFHLYESFVVSFEILGDNSDVSVFNSCVPFKAQMVECNNDYSVCDDIITFIKEIICDNDKALYNQMMTWLAKMVQYPDSKTEMLPILYSALERCGKTCFMDLLIAIFGIHSVDVSAGSTDSLVNERRSHRIEAQKEFRETTEDNVARFWNHDLTELTGVDALSKSEAYLNYSSWCESQGEQPMRAGLFGSNTKGIRFVIDARSGTYRFWKIVRESKPNVVGYRSQRRPSSRASYLFKLYRDLGNKADDLSWLNQYSKVIKHAHEGKSAEGSKTKLFHILYLVDSKAGKDVDAQAKKQYRAAATRARNQSMKDTAHNVATPEQIAMYVSVEDMTKQLDEAFAKMFADYEIPGDAKKISGDDYAKWDISLDRKNIKSFALDYQKLLMLACYILVPPLRSDWSSL